MTKEIRFLLVPIILTLILVLGIKFVFPLFAPFALGLFFACLIEPLLLKTENLWGIKRKQTAMILITMLVGIIFFISVLCVFFVCNESERWLAELLAFFEDFHLPKSFQLNFQGQSASLDELKTIFDSALKQLLALIFAYSIKIPSMLGELFTSLALGGFTAYVCISKADMLRLCLLKLFPSDYREKYLNSFHEVLHGMICFFRTQTVLAILTMVLTTAIFAVLRFRIFWGYGLLVGVLDLIPVLGPGLLYVPMTLIMLMLGNYSTALFLFIAYVVILLLRQHLELRLLGENFDLAPLLVMIAIYGGMKIFGFGGMFFGPLILLLLRAYYRYFVVLPEKEV